MTILSSEMLKSDQINTFLIFSFVFKKVNNFYKCILLRMNDQVKKIIKSSFCPKEKWVPDNVTHNCFKCDCKFAIYRRKHHCRVCGQIFCSKCSDFFLNGQDLCQKQKNIRTCQACHQKCWKYIAKHDQTYLQYRRSSEQGQLPDNIEHLELSKSRSFTQDQKFIQIQNIIDQYGADDTESLKALKMQASKKFKILLQIIMKQAEIPLKYINLLQKIAIQLDSQIPPNSMIIQNMNIAQNLRIKLFYQAETELQLNLEQKVLVKKRFTGKKLQDQYEQTKCVLCYGGIQAQDLVSQKDGGTFENMVANRTKEIQKLIVHCNNLQINLIFIQGNIDKQFEDKLAKQGITVIPKVKVESLTRLKHALQIQIVESIVKLPTELKQLVVGYIQKITTFIGKSVKQGHVIKKFFAISSARAEVGTTLFIQGNNIEILQKLKKQLPFIFKLKRHIELRVYKVKLDQSLLDSMKQEIKKSCYLNNTQIFFSIFADHHSDLLNYIKEKYLSYKYIRYVESDFGSYPEVTKQGLQQYLTGRSHSFINKWEGFTEICGAIQDLHQIFYSDQDKPIGAYILKKLTTINKKCPNCGKPQYNHTDMFYSTDQYVRVWVESRILDINQNAGGSFLGDDLEIIFQMLVKAEQKSKLTCHIQCQQCQQLLSHKIMLTKQILQYSFLTFINHMFKGSNQTRIRQNNKKKQKNSKQQNTCSHKNKIRVFQLGDKSLKIFVGKYTISRQCILTDTGRENFLKVKASIYNLEKCVLQQNTIDRAVSYMLDQMKSIAQISKNSNFESMLKNPKGSFIRARNSIVGNVRLSQAQCIDMILPQIIDQLNKINSISKILINYRRMSNFLDSMRMYHVMMGFLKRIYVIISEISRSVKKRQLQAKFQTSDFDVENQYLMEQIDVNSIMQCSSIDQSQSQATKSQISRGQLYSNYNRQDSVLLQQKNHDWLQPFEQPPTYSRFDRKTQYQNSKKNKLSFEEISRLFRELNSFLRVQPGILNYVSCYTHQSHSLIASALNSQIHKQCLSSTSNFAAQLPILIDQYLPSDLEDENEEIKKVSNMISIHQARFKIQKKLQKNLSVPYEVNILYPNQFEILRRKNSISTELFIQSIAGAQHWLATGGKSGSKFMRSFNDLIVLKKISARQFNAFRKTLPNYFTHLHQGSLLTPIYAALTVTKDTNIEYYIIMENLFFGMKQWYLYDFKGSVKRRFSKPPVIPLDINFLIDRNSQPIFCKDNVLKFLTPTLNYLVKNNIVDYSLILVVEVDDSDEFYLDGNRFQIGIVDYMRQFGTGQKLQNLWKGDNCTVIQPENYRDRILRNLKKYFTQIPL